MKGLILWFFVFWKMMWAIGMSKLPSVLICRDQRRMLAEIEFQMLIDLVIKFGRKHFWSSGKGVWITLADIEVFILRTCSEGCWWWRRQFCQKVQLSGSDFVWINGLPIWAHRGVWSSCLLSGSPDYRAHLFHRVKWRRKARASLLLNVSWFDVST